MNETKTPLTDSGYTFTAGVLLSGEELSATVEGTVGEDTLNYSLSRTGGEDAGEYAITVTLGENPNYEVTATDAVFTVGKKEITVEADALTKVYGETDPELSYSVAGLVGSDAMSGVLSRKAGEDVGTYAITQNTLTAGDNYTISYVGADLTITPAEMTVSAQGYSNYFDYNYHGITVNAPDGATVSYSEEENGEYSVNNPQYKKNKLSHLKYKHIYKNRLALNYCSINNLIY